MNPTLKKAYEIIFESVPEPGMEDWQIAEKVMERFSVPKLGEELTKECIFQVVNHIKYPNDEITMHIVGRAEGYASELWDELPDEPHMAEIERIEYLKKNKPR